MLAHIYTLFNKLKTRIYDGKKYGFDTQNNLP